MKAIDEAKVLEVIDRVCKEDGTSLELLRLADKIKELPPVNVAALIEAIPLEDVQRFVGSPGRLPEHERERIRRRSLLRSNGETLGSCFSMSSGGSSWTRVPSSGSTTRAGW